MRLLLFIILLVIAGKVSAQQDAHYTQFMFNRMYFNPAFAGSKRVLCLSAIYRRQWIGIPGAPQTAAFNAHVPLWKQRVGLGLTITNDRIGLTDSWNIETNYAYRIHLTDKSVFSVGLRGAVYVMRVRWQEADPTQLYDQTIPAQAPSKVVPNFGLGMQYESKHFYVGLSMPRMFRNKIDFNTNINGTIEPEFVQHYYLMGGASFALTDKIDIQPNVLLKYVPNTPFDMDINLSFVFVKKVLAGLTYRLNDSVDLLIQWKVAPQFKIAFAYDFTVSKLQQYNAGSIEVLLEYCFFTPNKKEKMHNPRYFF